MEQLIYVFSSTELMKQENSYFSSPEKLLPSAKYIMTEHALNEYTWLMNLTVRNLTKEDFVNYVCSSDNALGKAEGVVRLQGKIPYVI